jgi:hypothetical protein
MADDGLDAEMTDLQTARTARLASDRRNDIRKFVTLKPALQLRG